MFHAQSGGFVLPGVDSSEQTNRMRTVEQILESAKRLPVEDRLRLLEGPEASLVEDEPKPSPPRDRAYANSLALAGSLHTDSSDVSSDKYKYLTDACRPDPERQ